MIPQGVRVYLAIGPTDLRKAINGLSVLVQDVLGEELFAGSLFAFCNRARNRIKILYWDTNGFCLWMKRLEERQRFRWPKREEEVLEVEPRALEWLLAGLDMSQAHERLNYRLV